MKRIAKRIVSLFLAAVIVFGAVLLSGFEFTNITNVVSNKARAVEPSGVVTEESEYVSGNDGGLTWSLNKASHKLTITGNVEMSNYSYIDMANWRNDGNAEEIENVVICEGVQSIGTWAFWGCHNIKCIEIPHSVTAINEEAFESCDSLTDIYYCGSEEEWNKIEIHDNNTYLSKASIHYNYISSDLGNNEGSPKIEFGLDKNTIGEDIACNEDDEKIETIIGYFTNNDYDLSSLQITSSNTDVVEIGEITKGYIWYIAGDLPDECQGKVQLNIKSSGTSTITVTSPEGISDSVDVIVSQDGTRSGILENFVWSIITDGSENWASDVNVDGKNYKINKAYSQKLDLINCEDVYIGKKVVFVVKNEEIVWIKTVDDICVNMQLGINSTIRLSPDLLTYKHENYSSEVVTATIYVSATCNLPFDFPGDLSRLRKAIDAGIDVSEIVLSSNNKNILSFDGEKTCTITLSSTLIPVGSSVCVTTVPIKVNTSRKISDSVEKENVEISGVVSATRDGTAISYNTYKTVVIENLNYGKPVSNLDEYSSAAKEAAEKFDRVSETSAATLEADISGTINELFTAEERKMHATSLLTEAVIVCTPDEKFDDKTIAVLEKALGFESKWFGAARNKEVAITQISNTETYGAVKVKFTCNISDYKFNATNIGIWGTINYEIIGGNNIDGLQKSGLAGYIAAADVTAFTDAICGFIDDIVEENSPAAIIDGAASDAAEIIFGQTLDEILHFSTKYGKYVRNTNKIISDCRDIFIDCPVDVYVYDSKNNLVSAVENNKVVLTNENAQISVAGDRKILRLFDDTYRIKYYSLAEYDMSVTVKEYGYSDCLLRTVRFEKIPLKVGRSFWQNIDETILEETDYALVSTENQKYLPTADVCHLHEHTTTMEWETIQEPTDTEYGVKAAICDICNEWYREEIISKIIKSGTCGENVIWTLYDNGLLSVSGTGKMDDGTNKMGHPLIGLSLELMQEVETLYIEEGVTRIGDYAFRSFENLKEIVVHDDIQSIGRSAFEGTAYSKDENNWKNKALYLNNYLLCADIENITDTTYEVLDGTVLIADAAFNALMFSCKIKGVIIPDSVIYLGSQVFNYCYSLTNISIGKGVKSIGVPFEWNCGNLERIDVDKDNQFFCSDENGVLYNQSKTSLIKCPAACVTEYSIPDTVQEISNCAFGIRLGNTDIEKISIPGSVKVIGDYAFENCSNLTEITIPNGVINIGSGAFEGCTALTNMIIPDSVISIGMVAFRFCENLEYVHIPKSVTTIELDELWGSIVADTSAYICSDSEECYAKTYAIENNIHFKVCDNHGQECEKPSEHNCTILIQNPSTTTISYGDAIILHTDVTGTLPADTTIKWEASNSNFAVDVSADGTTCKISPSLNGNTTFTVSIIDANGNVISSDEQPMTAKAGFFDKIIAFFKKLFGLTKTIPQAFKGII